MKKPKRDINPDQQRFLLGELNEFDRNHRYSRSTAKLPRRLAAAQRAITAYHAREERKDKTRKRGLERAVSRVRREIYFGTAQSALAALDALKREYRER
jgi:hypothetical protein